MPCSRNISQDDQQQAAQKAGQQATQAQQSNIIGDAMKAGRDTAISVGVLGFAMMVTGIVLGALSLGKGNPNKDLGIAAIVLSVFMAPVGMILGFIAFFIKPTSR
uniref:Uncharacterized protein n=1 Tax=viral metagenome TaxID=1070528 RepID=A0A6C0BMP8_9ZZZZ